MKKIIIVLIISILLIGCTNKKNTIIENDIIQNNHEDNELLNIFNKAIENSNQNLELIAPLGEQVVAGKNYMFLTTSNQTYKIVVIYHDLQGNSTITSIKDFDYNKYINNNSEPNTSNLSGSWYVNSYNYTIKDETIKNYFDKPIENIKYKPIIELENKIILCYGENIETNKLYIYIAIMSENKKEIKTSYVDISDFL